MGLVNVDIYTITQLPISNKLIIASKYDIWHSSVVDNNNIFISSVYPTATIIKCVSKYEFKIINCR